MTTLFSYDPKTHLSGAQAVYRGYDEVVRLKEHEANEAVRNDASQNTAFQPAIVASSSKDKRMADKPDKPSVAGSSEASDDVTDLILVVHGIGQGVCPFVTVTNGFAVCRH